MEIQIKKVKFNCNNTEFHHTLIIRKVSVIIHAILHFTISPKSPDRKYILSQVVTNAVSGKPGCVKLPEDFHTLQGP